MEARDHQSQWFGFGTVLFGGGVVVSADWVFAVKSAAPENHLSITEWPIWLSFGMMAAGIYVMAAGYIEGMLLPGKKSVEIEKGKRKLAEAYLGRFHLMGSEFAKSDASTNEDIAEWLSNVLLYVGEVWGMAEMAAIVGSIHEAQGRHLARNITDQLTELISRCTVLPVSLEIDLKPLTGWKKFVQDTKISTGLP